MRGGVGAGLKFRPTQISSAHKTKTTPYHPESDGLVERFNRTLLMMLAMFACEHKDDWDDLLPPVMMAYRLSVHESTGFSPYRLMFGEECMLPMDIGMPHRQPEPVDDVVSPYAVWVKDSLEVTFDQVRRHSGKAVRRQKRLYDQRAVRRLFALGDWLCGITQRVRSVNWTRYGRGPTS